MKEFVITLEDLGFMHQQVSLPELKVIRYLTNGTPIYGYTDPRTGSVVELGALGTFNLMTSSWAAFIPNTDIITNTNSSPFGIRDFSGLFNNLTLASTADWGATNYAFSRLSNSDYSHYLQQLSTNTAYHQQTSTGAVVNADTSVDLSALYANPFKTVYDYTPRMIAQTVHSQDALVRMDTLSGGKVFTDHVTYDVTDVTTGATHTVTEDFVRNLNTLSGDPSLSGWSTLFGQFFDHGLDFIGKGGNAGAKVIIPLSKDDPMYDPAHGVTSISISRATVSNAAAAGADGMFQTADDILSPGSDGLYGTDDDILGPTNPQYNNHTSPYIDQSQTYGSTDTVTNLLRAWVSDGNGHYVAGMYLFDGTTLANPYTRPNPDGTTTTTSNTLPTLNELRAHIVATGRDDISWVDINNLRVRDANGKVVDLDPNTAGIQAAFTDHILIADMLPRLDAAHVLTDPLAGVAGHVDLLAGMQLDRGSDTDSAQGAYVSDYINLTTGQPTALGGAHADILGEILLRAIGDHYVAGDGRANENFGLTAVHHVWHENHNWQIDNLINAIATSQAADPTHTYAHDWQTTTAFTDANGNYLISDGGPIAWNYEKMFQAGVLINQTEYQHVAIDQYARGLTPNIPLFFMYDTSVNADVSLEYSQAAFRFGHSQLRETIDALDPNGSLTAAVTHYALEQAFLNPEGFATVGPTAIALGMTRQVASELDEIITPALQQNLLGQPLDLAAINIARGRDLGIPTLNALRAALAGGMQDSLNSLQAKLLANPGDPTLQQAVDKTVALHASLRPYISWDDFGNSITHPEALANFLAAYSFDGNIALAQAIVDLSNGGSLDTIDSSLVPLIKAAFETTLNTTIDSLDASNAGLYASTFLSPTGDKGFNSIDAWSGGLAEKHVFLGQMGPTFDAIFCDQMTRLINGDRFYYFWRLQDGLINATHLISSIVTEQFKDVIERTTGAQHLPGDVMFVPDSFVELSDQYKTQLASHPGIGVMSVNGVNTLTNGGVTSFDGKSYVIDKRPDSTVLNPDGTPSAGYNSHEVIGGTTYDDYIDAGDGDDTVYLGNGNDVGLGSAGADHLYGEAGNDTLDGGLLPDFIDGGDGDDVIHGGDDADVLIGAAGNDRLYGDNLIDEIHGDDGDDYVDGGSEGDFLFGGRGQDVVSGGEGVDIVDGELGDDVLFGGAGPDQLFGGFGDDIMHGGDGAGNLTLNVDECLGEAGFDLVSFSEMTKPLDVIADMNFQNLNQVGPQTSLVTPFGQLWVLMEALEGGSFADQMIGDAQSNWLIGGGNNDIISGGRGDDVIIGDSVRLDTLIGTFTGNTLGSNGLLDIVPSGGGKHFIDLLKSSPDFTFGNTSTVTMQNVTYSASVAGTADIATYAGTFSNFVVIPIFASPASDVVQALRIVDKRGIETSLIGDLAIGIEKFVFGYDFEAAATTGATAHQFINPASLNSYTQYDLSTLAYNPFPAGQASLFGFAAQGQTLADGTALSGNFKPLFDAFHIKTFSYSWQYKTPTSAAWANTGQTGATFNFSSGTTYAQGTQFRQVITFTPVNGGAPITVYSDASGPMGKKVVGTASADNLTGTAYQDVMLGLAGNDNMNGGAQRDYLEGGDGNDTLNGGTGDDMMFGGNGNDIYVVDNVLDVVNETGGSGTDTVQSSITLTLPGAASAGAIENLTLTGTAIINGTGNELDNVITGNSANNELTGGLGNDTLNGGTGADRLVGGVGNDTYIADATDLIVENASEGIDTVQAAVSYTLGANLENLTLTGSGALNGTGNELDNVLTGSSGANILTGGAGNDVLNGMAGNDTMRGGAGNDTYYVEANGDVVDESVAGSDGIDTVLSSITFSLNTTTAAAVENLTLTGTKALNATGNALANELRGNSAINVLNGGLGDDILNGDLGSDSLTGGAGADTFVFSTALGATNVDTIVDFVVIDDTIQLENTGIFSALTSTGTLASSAFRIGSAATTATDRILYDSTTGNLYYDADGTGSTAAVLFAKMGTGLALTNADFVVI